MIRREDWLAAVNDATNAPLPPSDALTIKEFGELIDAKRLTAVRRMEALLKEGLAEKTSKLIRRSGGGVLRVPAYRLVKKPLRKLA